MPPTTPFTKLEAVNEMLMSIGQAPVNSLTSLVGDVNIASSILSGQTRYVLLYGFAFNTDEDYTLTPDANQFLAQPNGVLRADPSEPQVDLVLRRHPSYGMGFWDRANHTYLIGSPVKFDVTWGFEFEDLPEVARNYIALSAARKFQKRIIGSDSLDGFNAEDEQRAWSLLLRDERKVRDTNSFRKSKSLQRAGNRRGQSFGPVYD